MSGTAAIAVLGAGSWGTALALQAARAGNRVRLWGRDAQAVQAMATAGENARYLPGARFPDSLSVTASLEQALASQDDLAQPMVLLAVPSSAFRETLVAIERHIPADTLRLVWASKGLELSTGLMTHEVVDDVLPDCRRRAVLSGPSFAGEVGRGLPTAITAASSDPGFADEVAIRFASDTFLVYTGDDVVGVEVGGAIKNIIAIAAGLSDGLGYGANSRVALINRGLREMTRFGVACGARESTFAGLACMGDLVLTCTDDQSRNRRMGLALARGDGVAAATDEIGQVVEGVRAARAVHDKARLLAVEMPICHEVYRLVYEGITPAEAVAALLNRRRGTDA